jgi:hypothetical protein
MYYEQDIIDTNKVNIDELFSPNQIFNVICYHINDKSGLYPFVQFLLCKEPYSNKFTMPRSNKEDLITNIKASLLSIGVLEEYINIDKIVFKGYYKDKVKHTLSNSNSDYLQSFSLLVDISEIDLSKLLLVNANPAWFALFTEIVNEKSICNIPISDSTTSYFETNTCLAKIYADNVNKMVYYPIPSIVYTVDEFKRSEFKGLFGESKVENKDYYYFQKSFNNAVNQYTTNTSNKKGVNRYAFFSEKTKILEDINELDLDNYSTNFYNGAIFATQYEQHVPISYHILSNISNISINLKEYNIM